MIKKYRTKQELRGYIYSEILTIFIVFTIFKGAPPLDAVALPLGSSQHGLAYLLFLTS